MVFCRTFVLPALASIAAASPLHARQNASTPCAQVSAAVAAQSPAATPTVPAKLAYECITSVPIDKSAALKLLDSIVPYFKWQSNTAWLKDPPAEYAEKVQPAVDIWGDFQKLKGKVENGTYKNEFEVRISSIEYMTKLTLVVWLRPIYPEPKDSRRPLCLRP
jgi:hypothetical protein